jgi:sugar lactone lactonase YvrE
MQANHFLAVLALTTACTDDAAPHGPDAPQVELPGNSFYPEGVAFDADGTMFVASIATGSLVKVDPGATTATQLVAPGTLGGSLVGITMSRKHDLLWLCLGTYGTDAPPAVIGVRPGEGTEVVRHTFPNQTDGRTGGLCNEITEDEQGNVYASDSFGARILRIPAAQRTTASSAAVWAQGPELGATSFGVNASRSTARTASSRSTPRAASCSASR